MFRSVSELYEWAWCRDIDFTQVLQMAKEYSLVVNQTEYHLFCLHKDNEMEAYFEARSAECDKFNQDFEEE